MTQLAQPVSRSATSLGVPAGSATHGQRPSLGDALRRARRVIPFASIHLGTLLAFVPALFSWPAVWLCLVVYTLLVIGTAAWMHRYFSHRSFKTSRIFQFIMAFWGGAASQRGALWWASNHRRHHAFADKHEDPHSPRHETLWHAHVGWIFEDEHQGTDTQWVKDLSRYPELRFLDRCYWVPPLVLWSVCAALGIWWASGSGTSPAVGVLSFLVWGAVVPTVFAWHITFCINSITHVWGSRRYNTDDGSRNNPFIAAFALGEGWHNNHHYFPHAANSGFYWWEIDLTYCIIVALATCGLVWDVKRASPRVIEGRGVRIAKPGEPPPSTTASSSSVGAATTISRR